jgi:hypothetical protein
VLKIAKEIGERVEVKLTQGGYVPKGTEVQFITYSFPQDCGSKEEFLKVRTNSYVVSPNMKITSGNIYIIFYARFVN